MNNGDRSGDVQDHQCDGGPQRTAAVALSTLQTGQTVTLALSGTGTAATVQAILVGNAAGAETPPTGLGNGTPPTGAGGPPPGA